MARPPSGAALALALLLALPVALPGLAAPAAAQGGGGADASDAPPEERPLVVALSALPVALRSAIAEARDHLVADVAQAQLEETYAYVQGFQALPEGSGALQDPQLRAAYAWTGQVVEAFLAFPGALTGLETAGAACRTQGDVLVRGQAERAVRGGLGGLGTLRGAQAALAELVAAAPARVDAAPVREAFALLDAWLGVQGTGHEVCLLELAERHALALPSLHARVLPATVHPTGRLRVLGTASGAGGVTLHADSLGWSATLAAPDGAFHATHEVPRGTPLGPHVLRLESAGQELLLDVTVAKANVTLILDAPGRAAAGEALPVAVSAVAAPGPAEVDRVPLQVTWLLSTSSHALEGGRAAFHLPAPDPGDHQLVVTFPGTDILAAATASLDVEASDDAAAATAARAAPPARDAATLPAWGWATLALLACAAGAFAASAAVRRRRAAVAAASAGAPPPPFPAAASFAAAVGLLLLALRKAGLVPAGRTVREWVEEHGLSVHVADQFDRVRYGGAPEDERLARSGVAWAERLWRRWVR